MKKLTPAQKYSLLASALVLLGIGAYWGGMMAADRNPMLNLEVVEPGKLLRSGEPRVGDLEMIKEKYGLGTIFCLAGYEEDEVQEWAEKNGVKLVSIKMKASVPPTDDQIGLFFDLMAGETIEMLHYRPMLVQNIGFIRKFPAKFEYPILIHCIGGSDRTGVMVGLYRMAFQGWNVEEAKREMLSHRHLTWVHPAQYDFLEKMEGQIHRRYGSRKDLPLPPMPPPRKKKPTSAPVAE